MTLASAQARAEEFLAIASQFHLGVLPTETRHSKTMNLSQLAQNNLPEALRALKSVDLEMLDVLYRKTEEVNALSKAIAATFATGNKIFLCGCGATGRLSLSLETLWIESNLGTSLQNSVVGFMAGGDVALIKSIENFEDRPDYGVRQLNELGFRDGDLLISCTEGGETPFVIGATEEAAQSSHRSPYFLYCNPDDVLCNHVERSRRVIENPKIKKINLTVGPMAISGSTRMQASTILMMAVGLAMFGTKTETTAHIIAARIAKLRTTLANTDLSFLVPFIEEEAREYAQKNHVTYTTNAYGITVLTDTTERSPTFSLAPFENLDDANRTPSLCYLSLPAAQTQEDGWKILLGRNPRPLNWEGITHIAGAERLRGFDISKNVPQNRKALVPNATHHEFSITRKKDVMLWQFKGHEHAILANELPLLEEHLFLKMMLNMHSTLIMGRLGRYHGNVMTWVRPSNYKLIDRSVRYVQFLLKEAGIEKFSYEKIVHQCLEEFEQLGPNEPVVIKVFESLKAQAS
jgi:N-acetylmuramic acid 6-phosphate etherase